MSMWLNKDENPLFPNPWFASHNKQIDCYLISDQGGFIPNHEELFEIIQELCKTYDILTEEEVASHNQAVYTKYFGKDKTESPVKSVEKPTRKPTSGFVYLIRIGGSDRYKIGMSLNPAKRLEQFQTSLPDPLFLLHTIKSDDMISLERFFHSKYQSKRIRGEWFELSEQDINEFCAWSEGAL